MDMQILPNMTERCLAVVALDCHLILVAGENVAEGDGSSGQI
jgi:hypothetical protein